MDKSDDEVYLLFFPDKFQKETVYAPVNYEYVHGELKKTGVTLKLLWQEYKNGVKLGVPVGYTKFRDDYLPIEEIDGKIEFPWFTVEKDGDSDAYAKFITMFCGFAKNLQRVVDKPDTSDNEKYASER